MILKNRIYRNDVDIFFIIGTGRCGSTLMAQTLNAHSKVCVPHELQIIFEYSSNGERLAEVFAAWKNLKFRASDYIQLIESRCPHNFQAYYDYRTFFEKLRYPILSLRRLLTALYSDIARSQGKNIFAEQTPWYGQNIKLLNKLFPQAKFIHMVRDGRDVAISFARTPWWHKDVNKNLEQWNAEIDKIEKDASLLSKGSMLSIRYEDFVQSPEVVTRNICTFLEIDFEKTMLDDDHHIDYSVYRKSGISNIASPVYQQWQIEKKTAYFSGSVYSWKNAPDINFSLSTQIYETLKRYNYDVS